MKSTFFEILNILTRLGRESKMINNDVSQANLEAMHQTKQYIKMRKIKYSINGINSLIKDKILQQPTKTKNF